MSTQTPFNFSCRPDFEFEVLPVTDCENTVVEGLGFEELHNEDVGDGIIDLAGDISGPLVEWYWPSIQMA
jgi:hypothetical protein